ncbi:hypothetical protein UFOVP1616_9 [uncultured Caudovirales phage]|uniref:Uncharacterized protein n=1 Tax=uncultured Caudovirales phage TaxID=2100421 RepID=A0A6J5SJJ6_9CAUD|nr:hypothetical protein UFOVP1467_25 [uncultured Caudovirales phage]CAB4219628.1 hypothetical protein UFOVP1616_9 [uncultured Caudovirales phage]
MELTIAQINEVAGRYTYEQILALHGFATRLARSSDFVSDEPLTAEEETALHAEIDAYFTAQGFELGDPYSTENEILTAIACHGYVLYGQTFTKAGW